MTTVTVSPKVYVYLRLTPNRLRIAACASVRYRCSSSRVVECLAGKKCLKTNSFELSVLLKYLPVISRCGLSAKGYGNPWSFAIMWYVSSLASVLLAPRDARAASAHVPSCLACEACGWPSFLGEPWSWVFYVDVLADFPAMPCGRSTGWSSNKLH